MSIPNPECWSCTIGETGPEFRNRSGADWPMRRAIAKAYEEVTGREPDFIFSGWGQELTESQRAVVDGRDDQRLLVIALVYQGIELRKKLDAIGAEIDGLLEVDPVHCLGGEAIYNEGDNAEVAADKAITWAKEQQEEA